MPSPMTIVLAGLPAATTSLLTGNLLIALPIAAAAGLLSFLSPCVLPLVPGYLSYVTGLTAADLAGAGQPDPAPNAARAPGNPSGVAAVMVEQPSATRPWRASRVLVGTLGFVLGFSAVFVSYGALFGGFGALLLTHQQLISRLLGVVVILMGLSFMGVAIPGMSWLAADTRWHARPRRGLWGAPLLGALFGLGWTPCIGPTLAAVQAMAFTEASALRGAVLSLAYCLGLGLPFVLVGLAFERGMGAVRWVRAHTVVVMRVGGAMLVTIGLLLVTGVWAGLVTWMQVRTAGWVVPL